MLKKWLESPLLVRRWPAGDRDSEQEWGWAKVSSKTRVLHWEAVQSIRSGGMAQEDDATGMILPCSVSTELSGKGLSRLPRGNLAASH